MGASGAEADLGAGVAGGRGTGRRAGLQGAWLGCPAPTPLSAGPPAFKFFILSTQDFPSTDLAFSVRREIMNPIIFFSKSHFYLRLSTRREWRVKKSLDNSPQKTTMNHDLC